MRGKLSGAALKEKPMLRLLRGFLVTQRAVRIPVSLPDVNYSGPSKVKFYDHLNEIEDHLDIGLDSKELQFIDQLDDVPV